MATPANTISTKDVAEKIGTGPNTLRMWHN